MRGRLALRPITYITVHLSGCGRSTRPTVATIRPANRDRMDVYSSSCYGGVGRRGGGTLNFTLVMKLYGRRVSFPSCTSGREAPPPPTGREYWTLSIEFSYCYTRDARRSIPGARVRSVFRGVCGLACDPLCVAVTGCPSCRPTGANSVVCRCGNVVLRPRAARGNAGPSRITAPAASNQVAARRPITSAAQAAAASALSCRSVPKQP